MTDETDEFLEGDEGDDTADDSAEDGESKGAKTPKSSDKRISDLQSRADKETARANKAEAQLKRLLAAAQDPDAGTGNPPTGGGSTDDGILDMARMFAHQQHPKLSEYGISPAGLSGSSPTEIAESAVELVARLEKIETIARNKMLAENGMAPEIDGGAPPTPPRDFTKMPKEDFNKLVDEAMGKPVR